jgi:hypothetical protein
MSDPLILFQKIRSFNFWHTCLFKHVCFWNFGLIGMFVYWLTFQGKGQPVLCNAYFLHLIFWCICHSYNSLRVPGTVCLLQFLFFVFLVSYPKLGDLCLLVVPSALTTLDHWSPEIKVQFLLLVYTWLYIFRFLYDNILFLSLIQFLNCALWYPF